MSSLDFQNKFRSVKKMIVFKDEWLIIKQNLH